MIICSAVEFRKIDGETQRVPHQSYIQSRGNWFRRVNNTFHMMKEPPAKTEDATRLVITTPANIQVMVFEFETPEVRQHVEQFIVGLSGAGAPTPGT